jgi:serine protease Do
MPEIVKRHFEEKRGYANYYFNRLNRDRVWKRFAAEGDFAGPSRSWTLVGPLEPRGKYRFEISDSDVALKLPTEESKWRATDEIGSSLAPTGSGGLFAALYLWRRLAVAGPEKYGEVYYLGTAPLPGRTDPVDVLVGLYGGVECRFSFDSKTGLLAAIEMFPEENADPCEVQLFDYRPVGGRQVPQRMEVRFGGERFSTFQIESFSFEKPMQP